MFGLTKREQRWKAEQRAAEVLLPFLSSVVRAEADALIAELQAARARDQWFCEYHPEHAMGHEGCTGPGIPESARIHMLTNKIRLLEQEVREAGLMRDEMASAARRAASAPCACACCVEAAAMRAHADDHDLRRACLCAGHPESERCDCAFCVSMLRALTAPALDAGGA